MIKKTKIQQIVNCFETGSAEGNYGDVSIFNDGPNKEKQITYGKSQTSASGNLQKLINQYIQNGGKYADRLRGYNIKGDLSLWQNKTLINTLKLAGDDPIMRSTQDSFFDEVYWVPAMKWAVNNGFKENLSHLVIYDSFIHSGSILQLLRKRFSATVPASGGDEKLWITQYLDARHQWLKYHSNPILRNTIYRTTDMKRAISANDWNLDGVFMANGICVS